MESKHELEKTAAGNLCSGIQDTGKSVILEASKLWELAWLFKLLPGIVCSCWQKHIFFSTLENNNGCMPVPTIS